MHGLIGVQLLIWITGLTTSLSLSLKSPDICKHEDKETWTCNYIPGKIPKNVTHVRIVNFLNVNRSLDINISFFQTTNWGNIKSLELNDSTSNKFQEVTLTNRCFAYLEKLQVLHIHIWVPVIFDRNAFVGMNNLIHLDMSDCRRFDLGNLIRALDGLNKLPGLQKLTVSEISQYYKGVVINEQFAKVLGQKQIECIVVTNTQMSSINVTAMMKYMKNLKSVNLSFSSIADIYHFGVNISDISKLHVLDLSHVVAPKQFWPFPPVNIVFRNKSMSYYKTGDSNHLGMLLAPKVLNISGMFSGSLSFDNCSLVVNQTFHVEELVFQNNNMKRLDLRVLDYNFSTIKVLDFSNNGMHFIHSSFLSSFPSVMILDLSNNQLSDMLTENVSLFGKLFKYLQHLNSISLSSNNLNTVPKLMFQTNLEMVKIDLSKNKLSQVTFELKHLGNLEVLDLRYNFIQILEETSVMILNSLSNINGSVMLEYNPISCSTCNSKTSVQWILTSKVVENIQQNFTCINEMGERQKIDTLAVKNIQKICFRKVFIIILIISSILLTAFIIIAVSCAYIAQKKKRRKRKRNKVIQRLQEGKSPHEFAVYLLFNPDEEEKVSNFIRNNLNTELKSVTGIDRDLVCPVENDEPNFNRTIFEICKHYLEKSSIVIMVLLEDCEIDDWHKFLLRQAMFNDKPIIIFMNENSDLDNTGMAHTLSKIKRISYSVIDEVYSLQMSWKELSYTVIDMIKTDKKLKDQQDCKRANVTKTVEQYDRDDEGHAELQNGMHELDTIELLS